MLLLQNLRTFVISNNPLNIADVAQQKTTKNTETVPTNYMLCIKDDCPKAASATRRLWWCRMMSALTVTQAHMVKDCIVAKFGMNMYYRMSRGDWLITPTEQEELYQLLEQQGVKTRPEFDAYVEDYLW